MQLEALKPCPHCGMPVTLQTSKTLGDRLFVIACPDDSPCMGSGLGNYVIAGQKAEAIAAWNRRTTSPEPTEAEVEAAELANEIWESLFGITQDNVPDALTDDVLTRLATCLLNGHSIRRRAA